MPVEKKKVKVDCAKQGKTQLKASVADIRGEANVNRVLDRR